MRSGKKSTRLSNIAVRPITSMTTATRTAAYSALRVPRLTPAVQNVICGSNKFIMEQKTQTFAALYDALPPTEKNRITAEIINRCNVSLWTIQSWKSGCRKPKPKSREILAELFDVPTSEMFPETVN